MKQASPGSIIEVGELDPALLVTAAEGVAGNNNDTTIPTNAALIAYVAAVSAARELSNLQNVAINTSLLLGTSDGGALGSATKMWSDLFLASGAVINFNNGNVTLTHSAAALAFAGGSSGYTFDALVSPAANDGAPLGSATVSWSDLFLASGGVINFNNGDVTLTHGANVLAFAGGSSGYTFDALVTPAANDGAPLGSGTVSWSDLFLASGAVINFNNGDVTITHSLNTLTVGGGDLVMADAFKIKLQEAIQFTSTVAGENQILIPDNIDGDALAIKDDTGGATIMRFKTANGFEEITLYSNSKIDGAAILTVAGSGAGNGLVIPNHATASPTDASAAGSIFFEVDANKLWVRNASGWVGVVLS